MCENIDQGIKLGGIVSDLDSGKPVKSLLIMGNAGSAIWLKLSRGWQ